MQDKGLFLVLSGPSGAGKGTVLKRVFELMPDINFSVSATTRKPRNGEIDGVNYHFLTNEKFEELKKQDQFYETVELYNNKYGTLKSEIDKKIEAGEDVFLEIDTEGALNVLKKADNPILIFVMPPSMDELFERLTNRGTETEESLKIRKESAEKEIQTIVNYNYFVVNDDVEKCANQVCQIIKAERLKIANNINKLKKITGGNYYDGRSTN